MQSRKYYNELWKKMKNKVIINSINVKVKSMYKNYTLKNDKNKAIYKKCIRHYERTNI